MNTPIYGSFSAVAQALGVSTSALHGRRIISDRQIVDHLARVLARGDSRRSSREVKDAATAFTTNALAQVLAPIERASAERYLFVPGRVNPSINNGQPLLRAFQRAELGKASIEFEVLAQTGEAQWLGGGGVAGLTYASTADDKKEQRIGWFGVRFGWDQFEIWQAGHLNRSIESEKQSSAMQAMDYALEEVASFGNDDRAIPGMFNHGAALSFDLAKSFGDPTLTADEMMIQLGIIDQFWQEANPSRMVSGVVMPNSHRVNMLRVFGGLNGEGENRWKLAQESYSWLANIITDERLRTASDRGFSMWQLWSEDTEELYIEAAPAPMLFGPFDNELRSDFIMLNQTAGVINKRAERLMRVQFPA